MLNLFAWGIDKFHQCALDTNEHIFPTQVECDVSFKVISAGNRHNLAVDVDGNIYSWGSGPMGELGHGYKLVQEKPTKITKIPAGIRFKAVAAGYEHSLALTVDGQIYVWGANHAGQLGLGHYKMVDRPELLPTQANLRFLEIAAGVDHSLAISEKGEIYSWGGNWAGQLGHGDLQHQLQPKLIDMSKLESSATTTTTDVFFSKVYGGCECSAAISKGKIYTWGSGAHGRLGHGDTKSRLRPTILEVPGAEDVTFNHVAIGYTHSGALTSTGQLYMWGAGFHGQLGSGEERLRWRSLRPKLTSTPNNVPFKTLVVGLECSFAITYDGDLYAWGNCKNGRLGNNLDEGFIVAPTKVSCKLNFKSIQCGRDHVIALATGEEQLTFDKPTPLVIDRTRKKKVDE